MVAQQVLDEATHRLVEQFAPTRIILFGSQARGTADDRSDVDLLVVCAVTGRKRETMVAMDRALSGLGIARDVIVLTPETIELRDGYVATGIVSRRFVDDAARAAAATVARADAIVSWNFRYIVRVDKMRAHNQVNLQAGFGLLSIASPQEVRFDEDD